jgi:hypothetical protein
MLSDRKSPIKHSTEHSPSNRSVEEARKTNSTSEKNFNQRLKLNKMKGTLILFYSLRKYRFEFRFLLPSHKKKFNLNLSLILLFSDYFCRLCTNVHHPGLESTIATKEGKIFQVPSKAKAH